MLDKIYHAVEFLSPPSARRATATEIEVEILRRISIPALREEGDILLSDSF